MLPGCWAGSSWWNPSSTIPAWANSCSIPSPPGTCRFCRRSRCSPRSSTWWRTSFQISSRSRLIRGCGPGAVHGGSSSARLRSWPRDYTHSPAEQDPACAAGLPPRAATAFRRDFDRSTRVGIILVAVTALIAILAPLLAPYDPIATNAENALAGVSTAHPLGTDQYGRDVLSRLLLGGRFALTVAL